MEGLRVNSEAEVSGGYVMDYKTAIELRDLEHLSRENKRRPEKGAERGKLL